jgi:DNA-directed RNA polymerase subunit beta
MGLQNGQTVAEQIIEFFRRMRPGDPAILRTQSNSLKTIFDSRHYDLEKVGRYKLNKNLIS